MRQPQSIAGSVLKDSADIRFGDSLTSTLKNDSQSGGFTHAYLTLETIRRYMTAHPDQRPRKVLAAYLDAIGNQTYAGSCVYHQADGCSLPRAMRADICNQFFCRGLLELQQKLLSTGLFRSFVVAATDDAIQRAALIHEDQMLIAPLPQSAPD